MTRMFPRVVLTVLAAIGTARAELIINGEIIHQPRPDVQIRVQVQPEQVVDPVRAINVPEPTRSAEGDREIQDDTPRPDTLTLLNEDVIRGSMQAVTPDGGGVSWQHPSVKSLIDFDMTSVDRVTLGDPSVTPAGEGISEVLLSNGDIIKGKIKALTAEALTLSTWYAGDINVKRVMVARLRPNAAVSDVIYEGPTSLAEWSFRSTTGQPSWQYREGALYAINSDPIGRQIPGLPDKARIEFNASWRGYPQFYFAFYSDNVQHYSGNCYLLQVTGQSIYMQRFSSNSGGQNLGNAAVERFQEPTGRSAHFTLLVDKAERTIVLLVDGEVIRQWNDPNPFGGLGSGILFQPQIQGNLKFEDIRVTAWDGKMPTTEEQAAADEDRIHFVNSDKVSGTIKTITEGQVSFETAYATLAVPVERVSEITFSPTRTHRARRNKNDIRATFKDIGQITLDLNRIDAGTIRGKSENFGEIQLPMQAFSVIEFNIYKDRKEEDKGLILD